MDIDDVEYIVKRTKSNDDNYNDREGERDRGENE